MKIEQRRKVKPGSSFSLTQLWSDPREALEHNLFCRLCPTLKQARGYTLCTPVSVSPGLRTTLCRCGELLLSEVLCWKRNGGSCESAFSGLGAR